MTYLARGAIAAASICVLAGCGGSTNSPLLGGTSPRIRVLNLLSAPISAEYDNSGNPIGTATVDNDTRYVSEGEGNNTVIIQQGGTTVTSLNTVFQFSNYYTVVAYNQGGVDGTFSVVDNNTAINNGQSQIRAVNADASATTAVDVYLQPGSTTSPTLSPANLISANGGLSFKTATAYDMVNPGQYTITVTPTGVTSTVLLMATVSVTGGQSISVYALGNDAQVTTTDDEGG